MGLDRAMLDQLKHLLRPLANRIANTIARAVVQLADDEKKMQLVQLGVLAGETIDGAEHCQPYGFSSVPLAGAEAVVLFPNGDRSHPLVIAAWDRRYRPTGGEPGQVTIYHYTGSKITMLASGEVLIDDGSGAGPLVTQAQFMNHTHATAGTGTPSLPMALSPSPALTGTSVLKAK